MRTEVHVHGSIFLCKGVRPSQVDQALRPWLDYLDVDTITDAHSLEREEPSGSRGAIELRLLLMLASRLIAAEGYGAEEVARVYERADMLALARGDSAARGKVLLGLESVHVMRGELAPRRSARHPGAEQRAGQHRAAAHPAGALVPRPRALSPR